MVTMKDIARLAGVSQGTVSNVINKKGNVASDKILLVEQAARQLGYNANLQAQRLRGERQRHVSVILPNIEIAAYASFYETLSAALAARDHTVSLHLTRNLPGAERESVSAALSHRPACIVALSSARDGDDMYPSGVPVVFLDSPRAEIPAGAAAFHFDYAAIARDIAAHVRERGYGSACFFGDADAVPFDRNAACAIRKALKGPAVDFTVHSCDYRLMQNKIFEILSGKTPPRLLVAGNECAAREIRDALRLHDGVSMEVLAFSPCHAMPHGGFLRYELDYRRMAAEVAEAAVGLSRGDEEAAGVRILPPTGVRFTFSGLRRRPSRETLAMITLDNPTTTALRYLAPHFRKLTGIELEITALRHDELFDALNSGEAEKYDLIRMDAVWRDSLEKRLCLPLGGRRDGLASVLDTFSPSILDAFNPSGRGMRTLPLDPTTQLLFYRSDLFRDAKIQRLYYETAGEKLSPPENFAEFNRVARFFTRAESPHSPTLYGSTMCCGGAVVAACEFLPRLRGAGRDIFGKDGAFALNTASMRDALAGYVEIRRYAPPETSHWWENALRRFADGSTAMAVVFINSASAIFNSAASRVIGKVDAAPVPGGAPLLGGGCLGVSRSTEKADLCMEFFRWLYSGEMATLITLLGGLTPCRAAYESIEVHTLYPWLRNIMPHFKAAWRSSASRRYPGFDEYRFERMLGSAVRDAVTGAADVKSALRAAQERCAEEFARAPAD